MKNLSPIVNVNPAQDIIGDVWQRIGAYLRKMDDEAVTEYDEGGHTWKAGLRQYHQHFRTMRGGKAGCEVAWAKRLIELFQADGISADEPAYPPDAVPNSKSRQRVDLRVTLPGGGYFWLEVKGSWPVCFEADGAGQVVPYVFGRHQSYLADDTLADFAKLSALRQPDAQHVGVLLIGFDTELRRLDNDVEMLAKQVGATWGRLGPVEWVEPHYQTCVRCWLWHRTIEASTGDAGAAGGLNCRT